MVSRKLQGKIFSALLGLAPVVFLVCSFPQFAQGAESSKKVTVCSATLNSSNEIETFREILGEKNFEFIELTVNDEDSQATPSSGAAGRPENSISQDESNKSWYERACEKRVSCDILVVSGHFGGSFFGSSGLRWSIEEIERQSCQATCDGIMQQPKEVFLFGCNTLAGKDKDHRSPEEYRRVLMADGFSEEQAEMVVAFRYSPIGDSFYERMRRIFRNTPRIYGFDSVAPSGNSIEPLLKRYLRQAVKSGYYTKANLDRLTQQKNQPLAKALKITALDQTSGARELKREQIPVCYLNNSKIPFFQKLNWIQSKLNSPEPLANLPVINDYLTSLDRSNYRWADKEFEVLERVTLNRTLRQKLEAIVEVRDSAMLGMQLKVLSFMKFFGWIFPKDYAKRLEKMFFGDLNQDYTVEMKDRICSFGNDAGFKVDIDPEQIPQARWQDLEFIKALGCVVQTTPKMVQFAARGFRDAQELNIDFVSAWRDILRNMQLNESSAPIFYREIFPEGDQGLNSKTKSLLCDTYGPLRQSAPGLEVSAIKYKHLLSLTYLRQTGCYLKFTPNVWSQLIDNMLDKANWEVTAATFRGISELRRLVSLSADLQNRLVDAAVRSEAKEISATLEGLSKIENLSHENAERVIDWMDKMVVRHELWNSNEVEYTMAIRMKRDRYCSKRLGLARQHLTQNNFPVSVYFLNRYAATCLSENYESAPEYQNLMRELLEKTGRAGRVYFREDHSSDFGIVSLNPVELIQSVTMNTQFRLTSLNQAWGLYLINAYSFGQSRWGRTARDSDVFARLDGMVSRQSARGLAVSMEGEEREKILSLLQSVSLGLKDVEDTLYSISVNMRLSAESNLPLGALFTQNAERGSQIWIRAYLRNPPGDSTWVFVPGGQIAPSSPLIQQVFLGLRQGTIPADMAGRMFDSILLQTRTDMIGHEEQFRHWRRLIGTEAGRNAIDRALNRIADNRAECEEIPRACLNFD